MDKAVVNDGCTKKKQCNFFSGENEVEGIFSPNFENYITKVFVGMKNDYIYRFDCILCTICILF